MTSFLTLLVICFLGLLSLNYETKKIQQSTKELEQLWLNLSITIIAFGLILSTISFFSYEKCLIEIFLIWALCIVFIAFSARKTNQNPVRVSYKGYTPWNPFTKLMDLFSQ